MSTVEGIGTLTNLVTRHATGSSIERGEAMTAGTLGRGRQGSRRSAVLGDVAPEQVRVRFPPSPTGNLHVGNVRSALFNWVFARHYGGTFVLRIEDTDAARNLDAAYEVVYDSLNWLGLTWDEGRGSAARTVLICRPSGWTSTREIVARKLLAAGQAYRCFCTREEIEAREAQRPKGAPSGYDGFCRDLSESVAESKRRRYAVRGPDAGTARTRSTFHDLVRGEVRFAPTHVPDFVIVRSNGEPLYTLVNPVDDSLMKITHVLRGEDLLPSTPRQIVVYRGAQRSSASATDDADLRPPADRAGRGQPAAVQAGQGQRPGGVHASGLSAAGPAQLPGPARLGDRRGPGRLRPRGDGRGLRHPAGERQSRPGSTRRSARRSTPRTSGCFDCRTDRASWSRSSSAAGLVSDPPLPDERDHWLRQPRWSRSGSRHCPRRSACWPSCSLADDRITIDPADAGRSPDAAPVLSAAYPALAAVQTVRARRDRGRAP